MHISDIYKTMRSLDLASSQVQFSTIWLGRSARYYSQLVATGREPSVGALLGLANRLGRTAASFRQDAGRALLDLKQAIDRHCERREIIVVRRHKKRLA